MVWSTPHDYDLTRTRRRASIPKSSEESVPECSGTYVIFQVNSIGPAASVLDIGECGPRPNSKPGGLRGRLATSVAHSSSERIAIDLAAGQLRDRIYVVWTECASKDEAKTTQDALLVLFRREFGRQPKYNAKTEHCSEPDRFKSTYASLKEAIRGVVAALSGMGS